MRHHATLNSVLSSKVTFCILSVCVHVQWFQRSPSLPSCQTVTLGSAPSSRWLQTAWPVKPKRPANAADMWSCSGTKTSPCENTITHHSVQSHVLLFENACRQFLKVIKIYCQSKKGFPEPYVWRFSVFHSNVTPQSRLDLKLWSCHTLRKELLGSATIDLLDTLRSHDGKSEDSPSHTGTFSLYPVIH